MGMSMHVVGFRAPTEEYRKKVAAWRACKAADVDPPDELMRMFGGDEPDDLGQPVEVSVEDWGAEFSDGLQVEVAKLPPGVTHVRFYCSW